MPPRQLASPIFARTRPGGPAATLGLGSSASQFAHIGSPSDVRRAGFQAGEFASKVNALGANLRELQVGVQAFAESEALNRPDTSTAELGIAADVPQDEHRTQSEIDRARTPTGRPAALQTALDQSIEHAIQHLSEQDLPPAVQAAHLLSLLGSPQAWTPESFSAVLDAAHALRSTPEHAALVFCAAVRSKAYKELSADVEGPNVDAPLEELSVVDKAFKLSLDLDFKHRPPTKDDPVFAVASQLTMFDCSLMEDFYEKIQDRVKSMEPFEGVKLKSALAAGLGMLAQRLSEPEELKDLVTTIEEMHTDAKGLLPKPKSVEKKERFSAILADLNFASRCANRVLHHIVGDLSDIDVLHDRFNAALRRIIERDTLPPDAGRQMGELFVQSVKMRVADDDQSDLRGVPDLERLVDDILDPLRELDANHVADALVGTYVFHQLSDQPRPEFDPDVIQAIIDSTQDLQSTLPKHLQTSVDNRIAEMLRRGGTPFEDERVPLPFH